MNNKITILASCSIVLLLITSVGSQNLSAYAAFSNPPSFGGGELKYNDGLTINGNVYDISKYSQNMPTPEILALGKSSTIVLKIFDNSGPTTIKSAGLYMDIQGARNSISSADTSISYPMNSHFYVNDPHNLLGNISVEYKIVKPFVYVTFHITPITKMDVSNLIVTAMDDHRALAKSTVINAIEFS
ncbi:MAG: hypothetical protein WA833_06465 [Nitrosotalea sp.]